MTDKERVEKIRSGEIAVSSIKRDILTLKELVDKATPKKILRTVNDNGEPFLPRGYGECPKCKTVVGCNNKYCRECGQRLEW